MQKIKLALLSTLAGVLVLPIVAFALPAGVPAISSLTQIVIYIENALWVIFGLIAVVMFVMAGILFLTAGGQPEKVQSARSAFIWGVAGVVVGIVAYSIVAIVGTVMQGGA